MSDRDESTPDRVPGDVATALGHVMASTPAAVLVIRRGSVEYANQAAEELLRLPTPLLGRSVDDLVHPGEAKELRRRLALHDGQRLQLPATSFETTLVRGDGALIRIESLAHDVDLDGERGIGLICCDITKRVAREVEWERAATHDSLTGLPNRVLLVDRLESSMARLGRSCAAILVMLLDLDGFKSVNDTHGHAVGDRVLQEVAGRLLAALRVGDTVARLAGDEFVLCVELGDGDSGLVVRRRIEAALSELLRIDGMTISISAGLGAITLVAPRDVHAVIDDVDRQMYRQKRSASENRFRPIDASGSELPPPRSGELVDTGTVAHNG